MVEGLTGIPRRTCGCCNAYRRPNSGDVCRVCGHDAGVTRRLIAQRDAERDEFESMSEQYRRVFVGSEPAR